MPPDPADRLDLSAVYEQAHAARRAGSWEDAARLYRTVLAGVPRHADGWLNLGLVLKASGRLEDAAEAFRAALRIVPSAPAAANNLGTVLLAQGRAERAEAALRQGLRHAPEAALLHHNLGLALQAQGKASAALEAFGSALARDPSMLPAQVAMGTLLAEQGQPAQAIPLLQAACVQAPDDCVLARTLGEALRAARRFAEAENVFRRLHANAPSAETANDLGNALHELGRLDEAETLYREALALAPLGYAYGNLGAVLADRGDLVGAEAAYRQAVAMSPGDERMRFNLACALLIQGQYEEGWEAYEARLGLRHWAPASTAPRWTGEALAGRGLLVWAEQGLGDTLQFCRLVPMLLASGGRVTCRVQRPLLRLLRTLDAPGVTWVGDDERPPAVSLQIPLLSLPRALRLREPPADNAYLQAEPGAVAAWRARLAGLPGRRIGLCWAGNPEFPADFRRSIPAALLTPLFQLADVTWVSLQKGARADARVHDWTDELADFADTAALVEALDLTIAVDTAVLHLAGALGRPAWLLNRFHPDWRWGAAGDIAPWYASVRQFRQASPGEWEPVVARVARALVEIAPGEAG